MTSNALDPSPYTIPLSVNDETPVPPSATARSSAAVDAAALAPASAVATGWQLQQPTALRAATVASTADGSLAADQE